MWGVFEGREGRGVFVSFSGRGVFGYCFYCIFLGGGVFFQGEGFWEIWR